MAKEPTIYESLNNAAEKGDVDELCNIFERHNQVFGAALPAHLHSTFARRLYKTVVKAGQKDLPGVCLDVLTRILATQTALMQRAEYIAFEEIKRYDDQKDMPCWGDLPDRVVNEHLPRLGKLQQEVMATVKTISTVKKNMPSDDAAKTQQ